MKKMENNPFGKTATTSFPKYSVSRQRTCLALRLILNNSQIMKTTENHSQLNEFRVDCMQQSGSLEASFWSGQ